MGEIFSGFGHGALVALLNLIFLPHQMMLTLDAIIRSLVRRLRHRRAPAGVGDCGASRIEPSKRRHLSIVISPLSPLVAIGLALLVYFVAPRKDAIYFAAPILVLWALRQHCYCMAEQAASGTAAAPYRLRPAPTSSGMRSASGATSISSAPSATITSSPTTSRKRASSKQRASRRPMSACCSMRDRLHASSASSPFQNSSSSRRAAWPLLHVSRSFAATFTTGTTRRRCSPSMVRPLSPRSTAATWLPRSTRSVPVRWTSSSAALHTAAFLRHSRTLGPDAHAGQAAFEARFVLNARRFRSACRLDRMAPECRRGSGRGDHFAQDPVAQTHGGMPRQFTASFRLARSSVTTRHGCCPSLKSCARFPNSAWRAPHRSRLKTASAFAESLDARLANAQNTLVHEPDRSSSCPGVAHPTAGRDQESAHPRQRPADVAH